MEVWEVYMWWEESLNVMGRKENSYKVYMCKKPDSWEAANQKEVSWPKDKPN